MPILSTRFSQISDTHCLVQTRIGRFRSNPFFFLLFSSKLLYSVFASGQLPSHLVRARLQHYPESRKDTPPQSIHAHVHLSWNINSQRNLSWDFPNMYHLLRPSASSPVRIGASRYQWMILRSNLHRQIYLMGNMTQIPEPELKRNPCKKKKGRSKEMAIFLGLML